MDWFTYIPVIIFFLIFCGVWWFILKIKNKMSSLIQDTESGVERPEVRRVKKGYREVLSWFDELNGYFTFTPPDVPELAADRFQIFARIYQSNAGVTLHCLAKIAKALENFGRRLKRNPLAILQFQTEPYASFLEPFAATAQLFGLSLLEEKMSFNEYLWIADRVADTIRSGAQENDPDCNTLESMMDSDLYGTLPSFISGLSDYSNQSMDLIPAQSWQANLDIIRSHWTELTTPDGIVFAHSAFMSMIHGFYDQGVVTQPGPFLRAYETA